MLVPKLSLTAYFLLILTLASVASAQNGLSHQSSDMRIISVRVLINNGKNEQALEILRAIEVGHPHQTEIYFLIGLAAIEASQQGERTEEENTQLLEEAIQALSTILINNPELVRVRLELARAYFLNRDDKASSDQFKRVLAGISHPTVISNINSFLKEIQARRKWRGYFGFSIAPDSNINSSSEDGTIYVIGLPFKLDEFEGSKSGTGINVWGGGDYYHQINERTQFLIGGNASILEYKDSKFDRDFLSFHFGPNWQLSDKTNLTFLIDNHRQWEGGNRLLDGKGFQIYMQKQFSRTYRGDLRYRRYKRKYTENSDELNGPHQAINISGIWLTKPTLQMIIRLGFSKDKPKKASFRNSTWKLGGEMLHTIKKGYTLGYGGDISFTQYKVGEAGSFSYTAQGKARKDRTFGLEFSVYNRSLTIRGFSPQLTLRREKRKSNAEISNYNRTRLEIQFVRPL